MDAARVQTPMEKVSPAVSAIAARGRAVRPAKVGGGAVARDEDRRDPVWLRIVGKWKASVAALRQCLRVCEGKGGTA